LIILGVENANVALADEGATKPCPPSTCLGTIVNARDAAAADPRNLRRLILFEVAILL
jgi:hypothetical protein